MGAELALINTINSAHSQARMRAVQDQQEEEREQRENNNFSSSSSSAPPGGNGPLLSHEGKLEKLSPRTALLPLWQSRFFKLQPRPHPLPGADGSAVAIKYVLMWYKQKGGAVLNSLDVGEGGELEGVTVISSPGRRLGFCRASNTIGLLEEGAEGHVEPVAVEADVDDLQSLSLPSFSSSFSSPSSSALSLSLSAEALDHFVIAIHTRPRAGYKGAATKTLFLRASRVDKVLAWVNLLAATAGLQFVEGAFRLQPEAGESN